VTKRALVTGGSGFVGANLVRRLLADGYEVHLLVRGGHNRWRLDNVLDQVQLHEADLGDAHALGGWLAKVRADWIFHLATSGAYPQQKDVEQIVETNVAGTINLLEAALKVGFEAFVNTGSSSEYGFKDHAPAENEWLEPNSAYAVTKAAATLYCSHIARSTGAHVLTLRLYSVYGPFEEPTRLMPQLLARSLNDTLPPLVGPDTARDYIYVDDVSDAFVAAASATKPAGSVYNIGSGIQTPLRTVVDIVRRLRRMQTEPAWGSMPGRSWDTTTWVADNRKARAELGWQPRRRLEEGIELMAEWLEQQPAVLHRYLE
jgi:nucleoside-diphosphate-sugar epimerase